LPASAQKETIMALSPTKPLVPTRDRLKRAPVFAGRQEGAPAAIGKQNDAPAFTGKPEVCMAGNTRVELYEDVPDSPKVPEGKAASTKLSLTWTQPKSKRDDLFITEVQAPVATLHVQTHYRSGVTKDMPSSYGRGTAAEDPDKSLGYHEDQHRQHAQEYVENHPPPAFEGRKNMTHKEYDAEVKRWHTAMKAYEAGLLADSKTRVDCVGTPEKSCPKPPEPKPTPAVTPAAQ
jgi:hypothetical protein